MHMIGIKSFSAWMIVISLLIMTMIVHPSLLSYLMIALNGGLMILTREITAMEHHRRCWPCVAVGAAIILIVFIIVMKINWLAI